jgi:hypothetical protein
VNAAGQGTGRTGTAAGLLLAATLAAGCGSDVSFCSDFDPRPPNCEVCTNGVDDDLDGLVDCADPQCRGAAVCANERATVMTSTTAGDSTTSTMPGEGTAPATASAGSARRRP